MHSRSRWATGVPRFSPTQNKFAEPLCYWRFHCIAFYCCVGLLVVPLRSIVVAAVAVVAVLVVAVDGGRRFPSFLFLRDESHCNNDEWTREGLVKLWEG